PERLKQERRQRAMAEQHAVARAVSESFVGRTLKVLIEGNANAGQLEQAKVASWEHGFIREPSGTGPNMGGGTYSVARGEADAPDIDGRVYLRGRLAPGRFAT